MCYDDLLRSSSVKDDFLTDIYYNVVVILDGNSYSYRDTSKVRGCRYTKLIDSRYIYKR